MPGNSILAHHSINHLFLLQTTARFVKAIPNFIPGQSSHIDFCEDIHIQAGVNRISSAK